MMRAERSEPEAVERVEPLGRDADDQRDNPFQKTEAERERTYADMARATAEDQAKNPRRLLGRASVAEAKVQEPQPESPPREDTPRVEPAEPVLPSDHQQAEDTDPRPRLEQPSDRRGPGVADSLDRADSADGPDHPETDAVAEPASSGGSGDEPAHQKDSENVTSSDDRQISTDQPSGTPSESAPRPDRWQDPDARRAWVDEWTADPDNTKAVTSDQPWAKYQREHAGDREVKLKISDPPDEIWADGISVDSDSVVAVEAKFVTSPDRSLYEGKVPDFMIGKLMKDFDREMTRYRDVIADEANPVGRIRLVTSTEAAGTFLGERARGIVGGDVELEVRVEREEGTQA